MSSTAKKRSKSRGAPRRSAPRKLRASDSSSSIAAPAHTRSDSPMYAEEWVDAPRMNSLSRMGSVGRKPSRSSLHSKIQSQIARNSSRSDLPQSQSRSRLSRSRTVQSNTSRASRGENKKRSSPDHKDNEEKSGTQFKRQVKGMRAVADMLTGGDLTQQRRADAKKRIGRARSMIPAVGKSKSVGSRSKSKSRAKSKGRKTGDRVAAVRRRATMQAVRTERKRELLSQQVYSLKDVLECLPMQGSWVSTSKTCEKCGTSFGWTKKARHCKCCGAVCCQACANKERKFTCLGFVKGKQRVCNDCFALIIPPRSAHSHTVAIDAYKGQVATLEVDLQDKSVEVEELQAEINLSQRGDNSGDDNKHRDVSMLNSTVPGAAEDTQDHQARILELQASLRQERLDHTDLKVHVAKLEKKLRQGNNPPLGEQSHSHVGEQSGDLSAELAATQAQLEDLINENEDIQADRLEAVDKHRLIHVSMSQVMDSLADLNDAVNDEELPPTNMEISFAIRKLLEKMRVQVQQTELSFEAERRNPKVPQSKSNEYIVGLEKELDKSTARLQDTKEELEIALEEMASMERQLERKSSQLEATQAKVIKRSSSRSKVAQENKSLKSELKMYKRKTTELETELQRVSRKLRLQSAANNKRNRNKQNDARVMELEIEVEELQAELAVTKDENKQTIDRLIEMTSELSDLQIQLQTSKAQRGSRDGDSPSVEDLRAENKELRGKTDEYAAKSLELQFKVSELEAELKSSRSENGGEASATHDDETVTSLRLKLQQTVDENLKHGQKTHQLSRENLKLKSALRKCQQERDDLQEALNSSQEEAKHRQAEELNIVMVGMQEDLKSQAAAPAQATPTTVDNSEHLAQLAELKETVSSLQAELNDARQANESVQEELATAKDELKESQSQQDEQIDKIRQLNEQIIEIKAKLVDSMDAVRELEKTKELLAQEQTQQHEAEQKWKKELVELHKTSNERTDELQLQLDDAKEMMELLTEERNNMEAKLSKQANNGGGGGDEEDVTALRASLQTTTAELEHLKEEYTSLQDEHDQVIQELDRQVDALTAQSEEMDALKAVQKRLRTDLEQAQVERERVRSKLTSPSGSETQRTRTLTTQLSLREASLETLAKEMNEMSVSMEQMEMQHTSELKLMTEKHQSAIDLLHEREEELRLLKENLEDKDRDMEQEVEHLEKQLQEAALERLRLRQQVASSNNSSGGGEDSKQLQEELNRSQELINKLATELEAATQERQDLELENEKQFHQTQRLLKRVRELENKLAELSGLGAPQTRPRAATMRRSGLKPPTQIRKS